MSKLTPEQVRNLEGELTTREKQLVAEIADARKSAREADAARAVHVIDRKEDADENSASEVKQAETERDITELGAVQAALLRLNGGLYGQCVDCEEPIPFDRLQAQPAAIRCAACQTGHEEKMSHRH